ncbi:PIG-L family deacetylase [Enterovibrio sp. ZSDZ35]|uniref:PIG-L family deacetylase n=1 Tax=Enterovibrio qingdaonensis TaxID=2899818 RepID=A0ABT5QR08_9GAMM|nr:PIG-L family deacetylase [Enterovibrio sp. ZSDZ35]MDD1783407.1 PIG-L family deacetylase [Enterovibrio sp. ZSDZ35]
MKNSTKRQLCFIRNPNFEIDNNDVYYTLGSYHRSKKPVCQLGPWHSLFVELDAPCSFDDLLKKYPSCEPILKQWLQLGLVHAYPRIDANTAVEDDKHLVVLEPHIDDAALSVGGALIKRRGKQRTTILTAIQYTDYTSYSEKTRGKRDYISSRREREARISAAMMGAAHKTMGMTDQPIRWNQPDCRDLFPESELSYLAEHLYANISELKPTELWLPLATGLHADHHNIRNAAVLMLNQHPELLETADIYFFEDQPYGYDAGKAFTEKLHANLFPYGDTSVCNIDISDVMDEKKNLVSIFGSQFKVDKMWPKIEAAAYSHITGVPSERMWKINTTPNALSYQHFERFDAMKPALSLAIKNKKVCLVLNDYFVAGDVEAFIKACSAFDISLEVFTKRTEAARVSMFENRNVDVTLYDAQSNGLHNTLTRLSERQDAFIFVSCFEFKFPERLNAARALLDGTEYYLSEWSSSMFRAFEERVEELAQDFVNNPDQVEEKTLSVA